MYKGYKYRIYPNKKQEVLLNKTFGCVRYIYNWGLSKKIKYYQEQNKTLSSFDLTKELPILKQEKEWLKEIDAQALQQSLRHLDNSFTKFFREKKGFPKFKSKHNNRQSYATIMNVHLFPEINKIQIPNLGKVKIRIDRLPKGTFKTCTVKKTPTNKYFVVLTVDEKIKTPDKPIVTEGTTIGIDLGIKDFAILSDGRKFANPKYLLKNLKRLKVLQKRLSRKQKGSKNREKARLKVVLQHEKITNLRKDFLHKITYKLTHENQVNTICLETLSVSNMLKNHKLARSILDVSWSSFNDLIDYKAELYGKNILRIGKFEPSSKLCTCGYKNNNLTLKDREWTCPICNTHHDRDILAANNIKRFALQEQNLVYTGLGRPEEHVDSLTKVKGMKHE